MDSLVPPYNKLNFDISRPDISGNTLHYTFFQYPDSSISKLRNVFAHNPQQNFTNQPFYPPKHNDTPHTEQNGSQFIHSNSNTSNNLESNDVDNNASASACDKRSFPHDDRYSSSNYNEYPGILSSIQDIADLFDLDNYHIYHGIDNISYLTYSTDANRTGIDSKLEFIYEVLNSNGSNMTLSKLEGFLRILTTDDNPIGTLTPYGSLMAHTCLRFLKSYIRTDNKGNSHDPDTFIYSIEGKKGKSKLSKQGITNENETTTVSSDFRRIAMFNFELYSKQLMDTIHSQDKSIAINKRKFDDLTSNYTKSESVSIDSMSAISDSTDKRAVSSQTLKIIKQGSAYLQDFISKYRIGFEPHFPRIVCGSIDRSLVTNQASITVPIDKSGRSVHIAFEALSDSYGMSVWPELNQLPNSLQLGTKIQIAWHKTPGNMRWYIGTIVQSTASQYSVQVYLGKNEYKTRYCTMKYFVPPNVPVVKPDNTWWRLVPREINLSTDLYVGSCVSLYDIISNFESIDCVICNVYYSNDNSPNGPIKGPNEEIYKSDKSSSGFKIQLNCACHGPTRRIRQGVLTTGVVRVHIYCMSHKIDKIIPIDSIRGYKLNYDLHAHFDGQPDYGPLMQSTTWTWVIPRLVIAPDNKYDDEKYWTSNPKYSLLIFPYHRNMEYIISATKLIAILHPELNVTSLYNNGEWFVRQEGDIAIKGYGGLRPSGLSFSKIPLLDRLFGCHRIKVFYNVPIDVNKKVEDFKNDYTISRCANCRGIYYTDISHASNGKTYISSDVEYRKKIQIAAAIRWKRVRESSNTILNCYNENDELVYRTKNSFSLSWEQDGRNLELAYRRAHAPGISKFESKRLDSLMKSNKQVSNVPENMCTEGLLEKFNESMKFSESVKSTDSKNAAKLLEVAILGGWMNDSTKTESINTNKGDNIFRYINKSIQAKAAQDALDFLKNCSPPCLSKQVGKHYTPINGKQSMFKQGGMSDYQDSIPHLDIGNPMISDYNSKKVKLQSVSGDQRGLNIYENPCIATVHDPSVNYNSLRNFLAKAEWDEEIEDAPSHGVLDFTIKSEEPVHNEAGEDCIYAVPINDSVNIIWSDTEDAK
ncbi:hypothetical protein BMR1_02g01430 [Babesia microti strain RI]|uniref:Uncharacterized protein n=1 Tax=Babesia microti (strain RI) TaxID=1133968 RepID=I7J633_BABMR|nr:hypothetical protein BMR1_02g01430 [Babesia microti strain RI]CCF73447.1 hypothetical protein BMR1_02g01430 [Babesia microti strain RI]|eukprot:XP_012648056.1 hypothetical protein BMR1_02g01430 [Babesia microti strain RI]